MKSSSDVCGVPAKGGKEDISGRLCPNCTGFLFEESFDNAHDAGADVMACMRCYLELKNRGLFQELWTKPDPKEMKWKKRRNNPYY